MGGSKRRAHFGDDDHGGGGGHGGGGAGRWLVSYADFMTLMFIVFTVLFSMARLDAAKYSGLAQSLNQALGPNVPPLPTQSQGGTAVPILSAESAEEVFGPDWTALLVGPPAPDNQTPTETKPSTGSGEATKPPSKPTDPMSNVSAAFRSLPGARSGMLAVALQERGVVLSIAGSVLFDPGQTTLKPESKTYLSQVASKLRGVQLPIMVEGTPDADPTGDMSAWDLSALRAGSVVRYFVDEAGLPGSQFVTIGYGGTTSPSSVNTSHRVNIIVLRKAN